MARCPECRKSFRVPEDEDDGSHPCPFCGFTGHEDDETPYDDPCDPREDFDPTEDEDDIDNYDDDEIRESLHDHIGAYGEHGREEEGADDGE